MELIFSKLTTWTLRRFTERERQGWR